MLFAAFESIELQQQQQQQCVAQFLTPHPWEALPRFGKDAAKLRFIDKLSPMLRFSGCSALRAAKCLRTVSPSSQGRRNSGLGRRRNVTSLGVAAVRVIVPRLVLRQSGPRAAPRLSTIARAGALRDQRLRPLLNAAVRTSGGRRRRLSASSAKPILRGRG